MGGWGGTARPVESGGAEGSVIQGTWGQTTSTKARSVGTWVGARTSGAFWLAARGAPSRGRDKGPPAVRNDGGRGPQVQGGGVQVGLGS